jgi:hypothetical protein
MTTLKDVDGAKVIGLLSWTSPMMMGKGLVNNYTKPYGEDSFQFARPGSDIAFSRDMDAGFLVGVYKHFNEVKTEALPITMNEGKHRLSKAVDTTALEKPYMKHPGTGNRGYKFKWWFMGDHWLDTLTWLGVYSKLYPDKKYLKWLYRFTMVISFPLPWVCPETSIFIGRVMGLGWYNVHSRAWNCFLMYKITGNKLYRIALKRIVKKFFFNPEILAMYQLSLPLNERSLNALEYIEAWLKDYDDDYKVVPEEWKGWYFNIENFINDGTIKTWYADRILSSAYRRTTYNWSKKMIKNEDHGELATAIDYIVLHYLWQELRNGK